jgi:hypothetical protein
MLTSLDIVSYNFEKVLTNDIREGVAIGCSVEVVDWLLSTYTSDDVFGDGSDQTACCFRLEVRAPPPPYGHEHERFQDSFTLVHPTNLGSQNFVS